MLRYYKASLDKFDKGEHKGTNAEMYQHIEKKENKFYRNGKEIIPYEDINKVLAAIYGDPKHGFASIEPFWALIKSKYLGIAKEDVDEFLRNNETAQIQKPLKENKVNRPIVVGKPMKFFQMDLADMEKYADTNNNYKYLLVLIDVFSKYAFVTPLKDKTDTATVSALEQILDDNKVQPSAIQSDNGSEFINYKMKELLTERKIHQIVSSPYHPQSNGVVERFNRTMKNIIHKFMVHYNSQRYVDALGDLVANYNSRLHSTTKQTPEEVKQASQVVQQDGQDQKQNLAEQIIQRVKSKIEQKAEKSIAANDTTEFRVGDVVRVSQMTNSEVRKTRAFRKSYARQWSDELYKVALIDYPKKTYNTVSYGLIDLQTGEIINKRFYADQLQKINLNKLIRTVPNNERPIYNNAMFNNEQFLRHDLPQMRRNARADQAAEQAQEQAEEQAQEQAEPINQRPARERKKNVRLFGGEYDI
jgi:hypothetical protein